MGSLELGERRPEWGTYCLNPVGRVGDGECAGILGVSGIWAKNSVRAETKKIERQSPEHHAEEKKNRVKRCSDRQ